MRRKSGSASVSSSLTETQSKAASVAQDANELRHAIASDSIATASITSRTGSRRHLKTAKVVVSCAHLPHCPFPVRHIRRIHQPGQETDEFGGSRAFPIFGRCSKPVVVPIHSRRRSHRDVPTMLRRISLHLQSSIHLIMSAYCGVAPRSDQRLLSHGTGHFLGCIRQTFRGRPRR